MSVDQRILRGTAATLSFQIVDADGVPTVPAGGVSIDVDRADGTMLVGSAAATVDSTGLCTYSLTPAQTATLDVLTATWFDDTTNGEWSQTIEIVGGYMFTVGDIRAFETLGDDLTYPNAMVIRERLEVETEAEWICDRAFTPRYARITVDGNADPVIDLGVHDIRRVRSVRTYTSAGASTYSSFTAAQLAGIVPVGTSIRRTDNGVFEEGYGNIVVEVEYGLDAPDKPMRTAALIRLRDRPTRPQSSLPLRTKQFQSDAGTVELNQPEAFETGIPEVDAVYGSYSKRQRGDGQQVPVSIPFDYDPQRYGLFVGGRR